MQSLDAFPQIQRMLSQLYKSIQVKKTMSMFFLYEQKLLKILPTPHKLLEGFLEIFIKDCVD